MQATRAHLVLLVCTVLSSLAGCTTTAAPESADAVLQTFTDAGLADCTEQREPFPGVLTCEDEDQGDLTISLTDTELDSVRATSANAAGPWIVGTGFIVITYDDDVGRAQDLLDTLDDGELYVVDDDGEPLPLADR